MQQTPERSETPAPADDDARPGAVTGTPAHPVWIAPFVATLVTLPLAYLVFLFGAAAGMACDACAPEEARRFDKALSVAFPLFRWGLMVIPLGLLVASWSLVDRARSGHGQWHTVCALLAPLSVLTLTVVYFVLIGSLS